MTFKKTMKTGYNPQITARAPLKSPSLTNTNSKSNNKNIHEKLRSPSPSNRFRISPSRKPSQTNERKNENYEKEITELKKEISILKSSNIEKTAIKKSISTKQNRDYKLIQHIMTTFSSYSEQLKTQLDFSVTQQDK